MAGFFLDVIMREKVELMLHGGQRLEREREEEDDAGIWVEEARAKGRGLRIYGFC